MDNRDWGIERWRIVLVLFLAFMGGMVTGYWHISLTVALIGYIAWLLFKLNQLHKWLSNGSQPSLLPDSNGLWERITQNVQLIKKKSDTRKNRMSTILKRMQGIISGLPYATVVLNGNNEIDWANSLSKDYLNIDIKTDRGQRIDNLIRLPAVHSILDSSSTRSAKSRVVNQNHVNQSNASQNSDNENDVTNNYGKEIEVSFIVGDYGRERQVAMQVIPVEGGMKLLVARDISDRINIHKMRKNFIANASHELRTPLTVISGYLEIMQEDDQFPENLKPAILSATDQSIRMQRIIEDLLTLSRLENSELGENTNNIIDVPAILDSICADETSLINNNSHTIEKSIDQNVKVEGSEAELISVCSNLIHNAIRHTQDGTNVTVEWSVNKSGEALLVIKDDGQGIPAKHLTHLTERFYRVDKGRSRDKGGTGLGLAIVQHIVQRHGAKLDIKSEESKGTSFSICFTKSRTVVITET